MLNDLLDRSLSIVFWNVFWNDLCDRSFLYSSSSGPLFL